METEKKYYGFMTKKQYIILSVVIYAAIALYLGSEFLNSLSLDSIQILQTIGWLILAKIINLSYWIIVLGIITYVITTIIRKNLFSK
ncbi:hypothetical protein [Candidatus Babela massiliensis]|uniref:Uncharacterized protein n=1 Tax=Candidatus Babela massiliensis TaxID=673862 RepID=V6DI42_9BACT|nr:hypothetical protein [Candidatus Babela massiliensis]CDK30201.1 hypothetical protein BABL1_gene_895 [Candidatus Babela massiliensis]